MCQGLIKIGRQRGFDILFLKLLSMCIREQFENDFVLQERLFYVKYDKLVKTYKNTISILYVKREKFLKMIGRIVFKIIDILVCSFFK